MNQSPFECMPNCGACCIIPSISSPLPGMPEGKPAKVRCIHLTDDLKCSIFDSPTRPRVCFGFKAALWVCGKNRGEAIKNILWMEGIEPDPSL